ncbi:MAG: hypothetical protein A2233_03090 [Candidatus Kerfeldbacteria bacterium RIFOXYA2_FULL_38_24]|uniref:Type IV secretion system coupling protein TraD DNA-binding domain-containing protein n=1 Tax=Candidatus Kerfeldbacteria bacterium RIFOXYB2_FULL_38_14 TaxID=1798547 RepID=A0A1G2BAN7_9BACT|nr:MAG: hypothetical protein A2233_03090 [Candidatus Kerfeldbacteria bacterium RIFOXYA2_FULL_38_24]OGY86182.1 MAG: hypothetical protein A2319_03295 [Candidatus Kerfeldbacteria bacterium RIFOXYB2_FULL_38_14]
MQNYVTLKKNSILSVDKKQEQSKKIISPDDPNRPLLFAQTVARAKQGQRFGIKLDDRRRHMYLIGKTGMGKSTTMENMIIQDIIAGRGIAVVDPHGDLVEKVVKFIPANRINDVIYFNPADLHYPIAFNILENVSFEYKNLISNGLVGVFKKIWADSWGPRLEYILINSILALLENPGTTLLGVTRILVDARYRKKIIKGVKDPMVRSFWVNEFNNYSEKFRNEAIAPIQNKVGQFLSSELIRNIVGQTKSTIDMRDIMDSRKILFMNLSKGRIGEENSALLGAMMITKIQLAAMSRVDVPEEERKDFYLYVDEFQNFSTESFANILSEARKYRLNIIMAHQYIEQLEDEVKAAVFGNVGTLVAFRVGATDAEELAKEFAPVFIEEDIVTLSKYHIFLRLMIDGVTSDPFSAITLPPVAGETNNRDKVIAASRERYAKDRQKVEESILKWSDPNLMINDEETVKEKTPAPAPVTRPKPVTVKNNAQPKRNFVKPKAPPQKPLSASLPKPNLSQNQARPAVAKPQPNQNQDDHLSARVSFQVAPNFKPAEPVTTNIPTGFSSVVIPQSSVTIKKTAEALAKEKVPVASVLTPAKPAKTPLPQPQPQLSQNPNTKKKRRRRKKKKNQQPQPNQQPPKI